MVIMLEMFLLCLKLYLYDDYTVPRIISLPTTFFVGFMTFSWASNCSLWVQSLFLVNKNCILMDRYAFRSVHNKSNLKNKFCELLHEN